MITRPLLPLSALALCLPPAAAAATVETPAPGPESISLWDKSFALRAGAGYRDNVLLSARGPERSGFVESAAEATLLHLSTAGRQFYGYLTYEDVRYLETDAVDHEQSIMGILQYKQDLGSKWTASLNGQYLYFNQIFDATLTEGDFGVVQVKGHSFVANPSLRLKGRVLLDLEWPVNRQIFEAPLDDYWESGPKLTCTIPYGNRSEFAFAGDYRKRFYDSREAADAAGFSLSDTGLEFELWKFEAAQRHYWDADRRWRTLTRIGVEAVRDNESGYYDYDRFYFSETLRWSGARWQFEGSFRLSQYRYATQTLDADPGTRRERLLLVAGARLEYHVSRRWKLYSEAEHERSDSNDALESYDANTVRAGLGFEF